LCVLPCSVLNSKQQYAVELWDGILFYIFVYFAKKDKLFYLISNVGSSIFLIVYLFNDDKLQYEWQKNIILLCSIQKLIEKNYISLTDFQNAPLTVELWEINLLSVIACCGKQGQIFLLHIECWQQYLSDRVLV
jgi:hypothetical protein